jgi:hypothetical protein
VVQRRTGDIDEEEHLLFVLAALLVPAFAHHAHVSVRPRESNLAQGSVTPSAQLRRGDVATTHVIDARRIIAGQQSKIDQMRAILEEQRGRYSERAANWIP